MQASRLKLDCHTIHKTEALAGVPGTVVKNIFAKDKKHRLYIMSALPTTKVDLNTMSARIGTGKGGLRFAPEELLGESLKVPPGSVTPLAIANPGTEKALTSSKSNQKQGKGGSAAPAAAVTPSAYAQHQAGTDVAAITEEVLQKATQSLMGKDLAAATAGMDAYVLLRLRADVQSQLNTLKNTAYTMGYGAGKGAVVGYANKQFA
ncbi:hypothetical protein DUNSADRAFT_8272 [Dunaliella salina]|uniref:YbaK/aminoacyl-tRNA synthetase-associated domain-containing protein n=1 Tax=Dunaliella salina TaxID=3046 RepID=A0ABQ7HA78_DUNSA|nr:hypothetical protein DUNSADRAFT_8272 [Dunaliella salina]|eukprot:KAF5843756.1 hypothetical protein DUNSADRAFT_8272 [Dunaliella salina]